MDTSGPLPVTPGRVLRKPDVPAAAAAIGVPVPAKFRTAADLAAIKIPWSLAVALGLVRIGDGMVSAGPGLGAWPPDDGTLLDAWFASLTAPGGKEPAETDLFAVLKTMDDGFSPMDRGFAWETIGTLQT
ncbi:MAG: hypothetical protein ABSA93_34600, partial [Streptosporangiaceae bacterium]